MIKRLFGLLLMLGTLFVGYIIYNNFSKASAYQSDSIYVYNISEDKVELAINENKKRKPASLTKLMTAHLALLYCDSLDQLCPIDPACYEQAVSENASMAGFVSYEPTTVRDLLYGTLLPSGGECVCSLAVELFGSTDHCVALMNEEAERLGMDRTHFANPDGMDDPEHYTSARDIAHLFYTCLQDGDNYVLLTTPTYVSTPTLDHPEGLWMESTIHEKLAHYDIEEGRILGGKSGTTEGAGVCWVTLAEKNDTYYIIAVMGAPVGDISEPNEGQVEDTLKILSEL